MWLSDPPNTDGHLHQGDLLTEVPLPVLTKKFDKARDGAWQVKVKVCTCVVISQCCTIEQRGAIQLARVVKSKPLPPTHPTYQSLRSEWPAAPGQLMYDAMRLAPYPDVLDELEEGQLWYADFRTGVTFTDDSVWLREHLRARMTPVARRNLRVRLVAFYGRSTVEDRAELDVAGEWSGLGDAPSWVAQAPAD